jgi:MFS family permease
VRRFGSHARAASAGWIVSALALAGLAGCALLAGAVSMVLAGVAYCVLFIGLGAAFPAQAHLLHERVEPGERATVLSVQSLLMQAVGAVGIALIGWQATRNGIAAGYSISAVIVLASAALFLRLRTTRRTAATGPRGATGLAADDCSPGQGVGAGTTPTGDPPPASTPVSNTQLTTS